MNLDFKELLTLLDRHNVRHLVVGGYAVMFYTEPRYTKDIDVFIGTTEEDLKNFRAALEEFGFPMTDQALEDLQQPNRMISIGHPPSRIDFFNEISDVTFEDAWRKRKQVDFDGQSITIISLEDLIQNKTASGREQDLLDLKNLNKISD